MATFNRYAPEFRLTISGARLPVEMQAMVSSIRYKTGLQGADQVEIALANPDLRLLEHELLWIDNGLTLAIGYAPDPLEKVFVGEITGVEPSFPSDGMPTINVTAQDFLQRLTHGTKDRAFNINIPGLSNMPLPDAVIAPIVSAANLLIPAMDPVGAVLSVLMSVATYISDPSQSQKAVARQNGKSDFDFLTELSKRNGWEMYIDHSLDPQGYVLRFQFLMQDYTPSVSLKYGETLTDFTPRLTTVGDLFGVSARIWVETIKTEFVIVVSWDYDRAAFSLSIYPNFPGSLDDLLGDAASETKSVKTTGFAQVVPTILGELLPRLNNRLTGSGTVMGDPRIKPGKVIDLQGLGEQFSGPYRITSATHTLDSGGYKSSFDVRKEVWFGSIPVPQGVGGLVRVNGQNVV